MAFTEWEKVESSMIGFWQYEEETETMNVMFNNRSVYQYKPVPFSSWEELTKSIESKGKLFNRLIKSNKEITYTNITVKEETEEKDKDVK